MHATCMDWVVEVNVKKCNRKWSFIVASLTHSKLQILRHFIFVVIVLFYALLILCFTWVESILITVSFPCNLVCLFVVWGLLI
jgi:hypothetical protein